MPGKGAVARGKLKRQSEMAKRKAQKKARFLAQRDAGKKKRQAEGKASLLRYGKSASGWRTFPGTPPNDVAAPRKPSTRNRPAKNFNPATKEWVS